MPRSRLCEPIAEVLGKTCDRSPADTTQSVGYRANRKAHVAFLVDDVSAIAEHAAAAGYETRSDDELEGHERVFIYDPFGNRLEFLKPLQDTQC